MRHERENLSSWSVILKWTRSHYVPFVPHLTDGAWELMEGRSSLSAHTSGTSTVTLVLEAGTPKSLGDTPGGEGASDSLRELISHPRTATVMWTNPHPNTASGPGNGNLLARNLGIGGLPTNSYA